MLPASPPTTTRQSPIISQSLDDLLTPGVVVEVDASEADSLGAFEETALSAEDAWDGNLDVEAE